MAIDRTHLLAETITGTQIKDGSVKYTDLETNTIQIEVPISFFEGKVSIAIDSTGVKHETGNYLISSELVKHLKSAYLETAMINFGATDATVAVELYNVTDASVVTSISLSSDSYRTRSGDMGSTIKGLAGKEVRVRVNVTTASATAGATADFISAKLILVLGIS